MVEMTGPKRAHLAVQDSVASNHTTRHPYETVSDGGVKSETLIRNRTS